MRKIFRYWRDRGFDVTSEGSGFLRPDPFVGLQPFGWWDPPDLLDKLYCGSPLHAEEEVRMDPENLPGLLVQFCLMALPWHYRNNETAPKGNQIMLDPDVRLEGCQNSLDLQDRTRRAAGGASSVCCGRSADPGRRKTRGFDDFSGETRRS